MYSTEEKQYLDLQAKFKAEWSAVNTQIDELLARRDHLEALLNGQAAVEVKGAVEEDPEYVPMGKDARDLTDKALVRFIKRNPGAQRADIASFLEGSNLSPDDIERAIKRCKNRGEIISEGRSRSTRWYVAPKG